MQHMVARGRGKWEFLFFCSGDQTRTLQSGPLERETERVEMHLFTVTPSWAPSQHAHVINNTHTRFLSLQLISTLKYPSKENKPCGKACGLATFAHCPESISRRFSCVNEDQHGPYANTLEIKEVPFHVKSISRGLFVYR